MLYATILFLYALPKKPIQRAAVVFLAVLTADLAFHNRSINPVVRTAFFKEPLAINLAAATSRIHREDLLPDELRETLSTAEGAARYYRRCLYPFCSIGEGVRYLDNEDSYLFYSQEYNSFWRSIAGARKTEQMKILQAQGCEYVIGHTPLPGRPLQTFDIQGHPLYLQKLNKSVPPAYVVYSAVSARSLEEALSILKEEDFDPRKTAILRKGPPSLPIAEGPPDPESGRILISRDSSSDKQLAVSISHPGLLIIPGSFAPGWEARVDGAPSEILEAYPASRAIPVPAGEHRVGLRYRPRSFMIGAAVTIISLVVLTLFLVLSLFRSRGKTG
jgi:hypothetical protein